MTQASFIQFKDITVEIIRSPRRKTMALQVKNGTVIIRMPKRLASHYAESFISSKYEWIRTKLSNQVILPDFEFKDGELLPFLGHELTIRTINGLKNQVTTREQTLLIETKTTPTSYKQKQSLIEKWYRQQAIEYISSRCETLSNRCQLHPTKVTVRSYKARWGSCNLKGEIQLNWRLIMAPPAVIDYVVIHELCHLKQHNHSPDFWQLVNDFEPNYKRYRLWLKQYGYQLSL